MKNPIESYFKLKRNGLTVVKKGAEQNSLAPKQDFKEVYGEEFENIRKALKGKAIIENNYSNIVLNSGWELTFFPLGLVKDPNLRLIITNPEGQSVGFEGNIQTIILSAKKGVVVFRLGDYENPKLLAVYPDQPPEGIPFDPLPSA